MAVDIAALESSLSAWDLAGYLATAAVAVGCIGESIVEFTQFIRSDRAKSAIGRASALILIVGLAAELLTQVSVNAISGQMIAALNARAGTAYERAADLGVTIDNLKGVVDRKTVEADAAITSLSRATQRMDREIAEVQGRDLTPRQIAAISRELKKFSGARLYIVSYPGDEDAARLGTKMIAALSGAGLDVYDILGRANPNAGGEVFGVAIQGSPNDKLLTQALSKALGAPGRLAVAPRVFDTSALVDGRSVGIMVGIEPRRHTGVLGPQRPQVSHSEPSH